MYLYWFVFWIWFFLCRFQRRIWLWTSLTLIYHLLQPITALCFGIALFYFLIAYLMSFVWCSVMSFFPWELQYIDRTELVLWMWLEYAQALIAHSFPHNSFLRFIALFPAISYRLKLAGGASVKVFYTHSYTPHSQSKQFIYVRFYIVTVFAVFFSALVVKASVKAPISLGSIQSAKSSTLKENGTPSALHALATQHVHSSNIIHLLLFIYNKYTSYIIRIFAKKSIKHYQHDIRRIERNSKQ